MPEAGDAAPPLYSNRRARYAIPDAKRLVQILRAPAAVSVPGQRPPSRLRESIAFAVEYLHPRTGYYVWDWRDPMPLVGDIIRILRGQ
ncbi:hypothetical protein IL54_4029 [Sphingobium sp. ba1]|nr:hypothetical protein IL54_4029 [Sphingobium sp. ba1]